MARASAGLTSAWAWAAEKWSAGRKAAPPTKPLRVMVFMALPFVSFVSNLPTSVADLSNLLYAGGLPGACARRQDRRCFGLRPVQPHDEINLAVRRRQPVGFLVGARRFVLDVERQRAIDVLFHVGQHRRIDQI